MYDLSGRSEQRVTPTKLAYIVGETCITNLKPYFGQPSTDVFQAVARVQKQLYVWPRLPNLSRLRSRLFTQMGAELRKIECLVSVLVQAASYRKQKQGMFVTGSMVNSRKNSGTFRIAAAIQIRFAMFRLSLALSQRGRAAQSISPTPRRSGTERIVVGVGALTEMFLR